MFKWNVQRFDLCLIKYLEKFCDLKVNNLWSDLYGGENHNNVSTRKQFAKFGTF